MLKTCLFPIFKVFPEQLQQKVFWNLQTVIENVSVQCQPLKITDLYKSSPDVFWSPDMSGSRTLSHQANKSKKKSDTVDLLASKTLKNYWVAIHHWFFFSDTQHMLNPALPSWYRVFSSCLMTGKARSWYIITLSTYINQIQCCQLFWLEKLIRVAASAHLPLAFEK